MDVYTLWPVLFDLWLGQYLIDCHCALTHYKELEAITQKKKKTNLRDTGFPVIIWFWLLII